MIQIHGTRKLLEKLPLDGQGQLPVTPRTEWLYARPRLDVNPLGGWHGNLVTLQRRNCLLLVHEDTRFPLILPALTKPDFAGLNDRFVDALMNTLLKCGADETHMSAAHSCLRPLQVESHCNRSAQGTLNRIKADLEHLLWYDHANIADLSGHRLGAWLANRPCSVKGRGVIWPQREMLGLLAALPPVADTGGRKDEAAYLPDNVVSLRDYRRPESDA